MRVTHLRMFSRFPLARHLATTTTNHNTSTLFSLLSPPEQAKFYAFSQRIQLPIQTSDTYLEALTHPSFNKQSQSPQFQKLQLIGESCLQMYSTEYCYFKFPKIQSDAMESLVKSFTGMSSLSDVGEGVGLKTVMQWTPSVDSEGRTGERAICARVFQALVGALYTTAVIILNFNHVLTNFIVLIVPLPYLSCPLY